MTYNLDFDFGAIYIYRSRRDSWQRNSLDEKCFLPKPELEKEEQVDAVPGWFEIFCTDDTFWSEIPCCEEIYCYDETYRLKIAFWMGSPVIMRSSVLMRYPGRRSTGVKRSPFQRSPALMRSPDKLGVQTLVHTVGFKFPRLRNFLVRRRSCAPVLLFRKSVYRKYRFTNPVDTLTDWRQRVKLQ